MSKKLTPEEFISALENDTLGEILPMELPTVLTVSGFVKPSGDGNLRFAPSRLCSAWIDIPKNIIKSVEYLGKRPCAFGIYDYATIELTVPISDPIVTAFAGLANAFSTPTPALAGALNSEIGVSFNMGNELTSDFPGTSAAFRGPRIPRLPRLPRLPNPSREAKCAACILG